MIERVILLSGHISSGKSTLATGLTQRFNMVIFRTRGILQKRVGNELSRNRKVLQSEGDRLDKSTRGKWVVDELTEWLRNAPPGAAVIVDSVRTAEQVQAIRGAFGSGVIHIHLTAPVHVLQNRFKGRHKIKIGKDADYKYTDVMENQTEQQVETLGAIADILIDTKRCTEEDVLVRAASHFKTCTGRQSGFVDVIVGGQYGSEGKGQIVAYMANEYDLLVRVGGPNAGHKVFEEPEPYTHHQLPSGTRKSEAHLLIGPGAVLDVKKLLKEIAECKVDADRLRIDRNAMIICDADYDKEEALRRSIGSTKQGVGSATARRILERDISPPLARDIPELKPYLDCALEVLEDTFSRNGRVLLEGTQGTGLSLYHGDYPYVTSRDTTVAGCLAEAGIAPNRVRRVIMVCRTYPIRVESPADGTSGPMSQEITWTEVGRRSGKDPKKLRQAEMTSTTQRQRRVGEFDWGLLRRATLLNGPTDVALTFTDYLSKKNADAKRFEQLDPETINFIQEVERVAAAPVSLVATGFNPRSVIDRRFW